MESGCPLSKIILGVPFYARHLENPQLALTFRELCDAVVGETGNFHYLVYTHEGYDWDYQQLISRKVDYVHEIGLGGFMCGRSDKTNRLSNIREDSCYKPF